MSDNELKAEIEEWRNRQKTIGYTNDLRDADRLLERALTQLESPWVSDTGCCMSCESWRFCQTNGECMRLSIWTDEGFYCKYFTPKPAGE